MNSGKLVIVLVIGFILGFAFNCEGNDNIPADTSKVEVRYRYITTVDTFVDKQPVVVYKNITKDSLIYLPSSHSDQVIPEFKPSGYAYTYNKSFWSDGNRIRNDIKILGWGKLEHIESNFTIQDTLADTITTTTKYRVKNALFAGLRYQQSLDGKQSIKQAEIDYNIKNKYLIGVGLGVNENNQLLVGGKVSFKIGR